MKTSHYATAALLALTATVATSRLYADHNHPVQGLHAQADRVMILAMQIENELTHDFRHAQGVARMLQSTEQIQRLTRTIDRPIMGLRDWENRDRDVQRITLLASELERDIQLLRPMRPAFRQNVMHRGRNGYVFGGGPLVVASHDRVGPADIARLSRMVKALQAAICDLDSALHRVRPVPYRMGRPVGPGAANGAYFGIQLGSLGLSFMGN